MGGIIFLIVLVVVFIAIMVVAQTKEDNKETVSEYMEKRKPRKNKVDEYMHEMEKDLKRLQLENSEWADDFSSAMGSRSDASKLEKSGDLHGAIAMYELCVKEGINSKKMNIYNYAHDIERLYILYRKTKQKDKEISFLKEMIQTHPTFREVPKWKERLIKLEVKQKR